MTKPSEGSDTFANSEQGNEGSKSQLGIGSYNIYPEDRSQENLIEAGNYDKIDSKVREQPCKETQKSNGVATLLSRYDYLEGVDSNEPILMVDEFFPTGHEAATLYDLLVLGVKFPNLQHHNLIAAPKTAWRVEGHTANHLVIPVLDYNEDKDKRILGTIPISAHVGEKWILSVRT